MLPIPLTTTPRLYIGIDIGKSSHVAAFLSQALLQQRRRVTSLPVLTFPQSRTGLESLLQALRQYGGTPPTTSVLLERTGHYHRPLEEALLEEGFTVYVIPVHQKKNRGQEKTDRRDALRLANMLYSQLGLGAQADETTQQIKQQLPPTPLAQNLAPLAQLHFEHTQQRTRLCNKLTAICDELFPEFIQICKDPNLTAALTIRERFPTPEAVAEAAFADLQACKHFYRPTDRKLQALQALARQSIGVKRERRRQGLLFEQRQLIEELRVVNRLLDEVDLRIHAEVEASREGQILMSIPAIGAIDAAALLAVIGNIRNFEKASQLRRFLGWAPQATQTGTSFDRSHQTAAGSRLGKTHLLLLTFRAVKIEPWKSFYRRLVLKKCSYDSRLKIYRGKMKVIGRLAGTIAAMIFTLLKADAAVVDATPEGAEPPVPALYDRELHLAHRRGERRTEQNRATS